MATQVERITALEVSSSEMKDKIKEHDSRIKELENVQKIVFDLAETVDKQSTNIDKVTEALNTTNEVINNLKITQKELEVKQQYAVMESISKFLKGLKPKDIIMFIMALIIIIGAAFGKQTIDNETQKQVTEIINNIENNDTAE